MIWPFRRKLTPQEQRVVELCDQALAESRQRSDAIVAALARGDVGVKRLADGTTLRYVRI